MKFEKNGKFLSELRKEKGMTQLELANLLHYSDKTISRWENGISFPDENTLEKISKIFNVTIGELTYGERITKENQENLNKSFFMNYRLLLKQYIKNKKILVLFTIIIILLITIILFISIYFIFIRNSIKIYTLKSNDNNFDINANLITTNDMSMLYFDKIKGLDGKEIKNIEFYYKENKDKKNLIITFENENQFIYENNGYNEYNLYKLKDKDLYVDLEYEEGLIKTIKLSKELNYSNNNIFPKKSTSISEDNESTKDYKNLSQDFIKFLLNEGFEKKSDYYEMNLQDKINITLNDYTFLLVIDDVGSLSADLNSNKVSYIIFENNETLYGDYYLNGFETKNCKVENCTEIVDYVKYINYFFKKYIELN